MPSKTFREFFMTDLSPDEREQYARHAGSSRGYLTQVAYGNKSVELGFADVLVALSRGRLSLDGLPLTDNAARQRLIREAAGIPAKVEPERRASNGRRKEDQAEVR